MKEWRVKPIQWETRDCCGMGHYGQVLRRKVGQPVHSILSLKVSGVRRLKAQVNGQHQKNSIRPSEKRKMTKAHVDGHHALIHGDHAWADGRGRTGQNKTDYDSYQIMENPLWVVIESLHDVSASHLEASVFYVRSQNVKTFNYDPTRVPIDSLQYEHWIQ